MQPITPPEAIEVEVIAAQATQADAGVIAQLESQLSTPLPGVAYIVKVRLKFLPEVTSRGWALYVDDFRVPKYWVYRYGIYFKVFDPRFFEKYKGAALRFSADDREFTDTGLTLIASPKVTQADARADRPLPQQDELLR